MEKVNIEDIKNLPTEQRNPRTKDLSDMSTLEMVLSLSKENRNIAQAVEAECQSIAAAVEMITDSLRNGGRLIYIGAGTSGRLGILDASECLPTFSVPPEMIRGIIAGGDKAIRTSVENAEDDPEGAKIQLKSLSLCPSDTVCGIAASGRTRYVIGGLDYAKSVGAHTICVTNVKNSILSSHSDIAIEVAVGPEPITGSTRMKSGTAQKLVLNILSTASMVKLGKTYGNLMVDLKATNEKLTARSINLLLTIFPGAGSEILSQKLKDAGGRVKLAAVMYKFGVSADKAEKILKRNKDFLGAALGDTNAQKYFCE